MGEVLGQTTVDGRKNTRDLAAPFTQGIAEEFAVCQFGHGPFAAAHHPGKTMSLHSSMPALVRAHSVFVGTIVFGKNGEGIRATVVAIAVYGPGK